MTENKKPESIESERFKKNFSKLKFIKNEQLEILLPMSEVAAYNKISNTEEVPVFFIPKTEKFAFFLPNGFINDFKKSEITSKSHNFNKLEWFTDEDKKEYVGFSAGSIKELRELAKTPTSMYSVFKKEYENHLSDIKNGEVVIFIAFENREQKDLFQLNNGNNRLDKKSDVMESSFSMIEYFKAVKFNNKYYLFDKENNIDQSTAFDFDKEKYQEMGLLIIPYTEQDYKMVEKIYDRFVNLSNSIYSFFTETHQTNMLDKDLGEHTLSIELAPKSLKKLKP